MSRNRSRREEKIAETVARDRSIEILTVRTPRGAPYIRKEGMYGVVHDRETRAVVQVSHSGTAITEYIGLSIAGACGRAISDRAGISIANDFGTAIVGDWYGIAISGDGGLSIANYLSCAMTGKDGNIVLQQAEEGKYYQVTARAGRDIEPYTLYYLPLGKTVPKRITFKEATAKMDCYDMQYLCGKRLKEMIHKPRLEIRIDGKKHTIW